MNLYIGNKYFNYNESKLQRLDNGKSITNLVYRNGNKVIKIFKSTVDEDFYKYFVNEKLKLKVISTPIDLLYNDSKELVANTSIYRDGISKFKDYYKYLSNMYKEEFMKNFNLLYEDIELLSKKEIMVCDLTLFNCVFKDGILYHIDYGSFKKSRSASKVNEAMYNMFVLCLLKRICFLEKGYIPEWVLSTNRLDFLKKNMKENDKVKEFVKRIK